MADSFEIGYTDLEDRLLLAVNVAQFGSEVRLVGDPTSNVVSVRQVGSNTLRVVADGETTDFSLSSVSTVNFFGGDGNDVFTSTTSLNTNAFGQNGNDTFTTGGGNDRLDGGNGDDTLTSSGGSNRLIGHIGNDDIFGGSGIDNIFGGNGNDTISAGAGNDRISGGDGADDINGDAGVDVIFGLAGADTIQGGSGNDSLFGGDGLDTILGGVGNDLLRGGSGNDTLRGNDGNDRILGETGVDLLDGAAGLDRLFGGDDNDILRGGNDADFLLGGDGNDELFGEQGNDNLRGGNGADELFGGDQVDRIAGDAGDDFLDGGNAFDRVFGDAGADTIVSTSADFVRGGAGDDVIDLSNQSGDAVSFLGNFSNYRVTNDSGVLVVRDVRNSSSSEGLDLITGADSLRFADQARLAQPNVTQQVFVQPIVVSDNNGGNTAGFFGNSDQAFDIRREIDEIYLQANVDIEWLPTRTLNNTFINRGTNGDGIRASGDLEEIIDRGDDLGVGNGDPLVIDAYFVEVVPQFRPQQENVANGLAFVNANGTAISIGNSLLGSSSGRAIAARVTAHEIGHNLGLGHVSDSSNLLANGDQLNSSQSATIMSSSFSQDCTNSSGCMCGCCC